MIRSVAVLGVCSVRLFVMLYLFLRRRTSCRRGADGVVLLFSLVHRV